MAIPGITFLLLLCSAQTFAQYSFHTFAGANGASEGDDLFGVNGWTRKDVDWGSIQPNGSTWVQSYLDEYGQGVLGCLKDNVTTLPILDYIPLWAIDTSARNWTWGSNFYQILPQPNDIYFMETYTVHNGTYTRTGNGTVQTRFPPANVADWENYVTKVVDFLGSPPYNLEYFQIWNEAHICSGFYYGSMSDYFEKIHNPAAKIIQAAGKKVVYGGYPSCGAVPDLISWIDQSSAWKYIDELDVHYYSIGGMETLRSTAVARGFPNMGVWSTEIGFTPQLNYIADNYPRYLYWAATHNWTDANKYRVMYYSNWAPNDPKAFGYQLMLHSGSSIYVHGYNLLTLGSDLFFNNSAISAFSGLQSTTPAVPVGAYGGNSIEAFSCANTIVFAVHISNTTASNYFVITASVDPKSVTKAERVDISGTRLDITNSINSSMNSVTVTSPRNDASGTLGEKWNSPYGQRVFYVVLTLSSPSGYLPKMQQTISQIKIV